MQKIENGIYKIEAGLYEVRAEVGFDSRGKRKQVKRRVHGTLSDARNKRATLHIGADVKADTSITLDDFFERYCEITADKVTAITLNIYSRQYQYYVKGTLGKSKLKRITALDIELLLGKLPSREMAKKIYDLLRTVLNKAVRWGFLDTNPINNVDKPIVFKDRTKRKCYTAEELKAVLSLIDGKWYANTIYVMVASGARASEALALDYSDIDMANNRIRFHKAFTQDTPYNFTLKNRTKNEGSARWVSVSKTLIELIGEGVGPLTVNTAGERASVTQVSNAFSRLMAKHDMPYFPLKNFRHCFATEMLANGASTTEVAQAMGHSNSYITDTYLDMRNENTNKGSIRVGDILLTR